MNRYQSLLSPARALSLLLLGLCLLMPLAGPAADIVINEVLASNTTNAPLAGFPDYTPDYVELYNTTSNDIDLAAGQWTLSRKKNPSILDPEAFYHFPSGTIIPADSYLLVFFDGESTMPGLHTTFLNGTNRITFSLARTGDEVKLFRNVNVPVDGVSFGPQVENLSIGRVPDFTGDFTLTVATPAGGTVPYTTNTPAPFVPAPAASSGFTLKINEWVAFSISGGKTNDDWVEIYNPATNVVLLSGLWVVDKDKEFAKPGNQLKPLSFIGPQAYLQLFADGKGSNPNSLDFSLSSSSGDELHIYASDRTALIDSVAFAALPTANASRGRVPDGGTTIIQLQNESPEESNFATIPEVAISEVLSHSDPPLEDAIELVNLTGSPQNIGHWWLSNSRDNAKKYRIPSGTTVPAYGFKVFYELQFNSSAAAQPFTLNSANGDECYLFKADSSGNLTGFRRGITVGPAANGVSFIRHVVTNHYETNIDLVASQALSFGTSVKATDPVNLLSTFRSGAGASNSGPLIGPVVINEIHYHPPPLEGGVDDIITEFIELYNSSESTVLLYDSTQYFADRNYSPAPDGSVLLAGQRYADGRTNVWRIRGEVNFEFPEGSSLEAGKFALVVNFDPSGASTNLFFQNFTNKFPALAGRIPAEVKLYGPYRGKLGNRAATVELRRPDVPQGPIHPDFRLVPYINVEEIDYRDGNAWPLTADGGGQSAQRTSAYEYGNNGAAWFGGSPTPGGFNSTSGAEPPSISRQPASLTLVAGRSATFSVSARGALLRYQWLTNGMALPNATNATLTLANITTNQGATFTVVITNLAGTVTSGPATLVVTAPINDSVRPTIIIASPSAGSTTNGIIFVTGKAADKAGITAVYYSVNGGEHLAATGSVTYAVWGTPSGVSLEPGTNTVSAYSVDQAGNNSLTNTRSYFLSVRTPLTIAVNGGGTVNGATTGQLLELGRSFALTATPAAGQVFSNWLVTTNLTLALESSSPALSFSLVSNTVVTVNFVPNPFTIAAGKYHGLFYDTNEVLHGSSGHFILTTTAGGGYSAALLTSGLKLSASGQLDLTGRATNIVARKGTNALTVTWSVALDGSDTVTGTVTETNAGWSAELTGDRAVFTKTNPCTLAGKYTLVLPGLPGDNFVPGGASYGTVSIDSNGVATLKGFLSDKTSASQKGQLSKNGEWPLYIPLYSNKGSLLSWIGFTNRLTDDFHGLLNWSKPAQPTAKYYKLGFATNENVGVGSRYTAPVGTNKILHITSGELFLSGGNLAQEYGNALNLGLSSKVTNLGSNKMTLTFTTASGLFKGSLTPTNAGAKAIAFNGTVLQKTTNAFGHFLGTNQSGTVSIQAAP